MLRINQITARIQPVLKACWKGIREVFAKDLFDSKWGRRVMDQIFREGKFDGQSSC